MVLTYQEAVQAAADAIYDHGESTEFIDDTRCDDCFEVIDTGDLTRDQASHQATAVLSAVGYADLLAEVTRLTRLERQTRGELAEAVTERDAFRDKVDVLAVRNHNLRAALDSEVS